MRSSAQSPPFTSTSGCTLRMVSSGVSSSNTVTRSMQPSAASTAMRSSQRLIGRSSPLPSRRTEASLFTASRPRMSPEFSPALTSVGTTTNEMAVPPPDAVLVFRSDTREGAMARAAAMASAFGGDVAGGRTSSTEALPYTHAHKSVSTHKYDKHTRDIHEPHTKARAHTSTSQRRMDT